MKHSNHNALLNRIIFEAVSAQFYRPDDLLGKVLQNEYGFNDITQNDVRDCEMAYILSAMKIPLDSQDFMLSKKEREQKFFTETFAQYKSIQSILSEIEVRVQNYARDTNDVFYRYSYVQGLLQALMDYKEGDVRFSA